MDIHKDNAKFKRTDQTSNQGDWDRYIKEISQNILN